MKNDGKKDKDQDQDKKAEDKEDLEQISDSASNSKTDPDNYKDEKLKNQPKAKEKASSLSNSNSNSNSHSHSTPHSPSKRKGSRYQAPSLKSLDDIENEIDDHKAQSAQDRPEWKEETVKAFFEKLSETANPPSTRSVLKGTEVHLKDGRLLLRVASNVDKSTLLQETWIIQEVRDYFQKPKLQIWIEIDEERRKESLEYSRPVSKKEMLDQMIEENPIIDKLREILDLRFDK